MKHGFVVFNTCKSLSASQDPRHAFTLYTPSCPPQGPRSLVPSFVPSFPRSLVPLFPRSPR